MLYTETVEPRTFSLLRELMKLPLLNGFSLVDGTALSLRYGHRSSIDLDLFSHEKFDKALVIKALETAFGSRLSYKDQQTGFGIFCFIDDIQVDLIQYPCFLIEVPSVEDALGKSIEIPQKLAEFGKREKVSLEMSSGYGDFKEYLMAL